MYSPSTANFAEHIIVNGQHSFRYTEDITSVAYMAEMSNHITRQKLYIYKSWKKESIWMTDILSLKNFSMIIFIELLTTHPKVWSPVMQPSLSCPLPIPPLLIQAHTASQVQIQTWENTHTICTQTSISTHLVEQHTNVLYILIS